MIIHSYKKGSASVQLLRQELQARGIKVLVLQREPHDHRPKILNWGSRPLGFELRPGSLLLNPPATCRLLSDKLKFFRACGDSPWIPRWTTNAEKARDWETVVVRHKTAASGGEGIEILPGNAPLPVAPLYVQYQKKTHEYRLHVFRSKTGVPEIRHQQRKIAKPGFVENVQNWQVRNLDNGFVFVQHGFDVPDVAKEAAICVFETFGDLDFAAMDVIYHKPSGSTYVLEGNTAPGIEGQTVKVYADFIQERFGI
jgi:hypothetical protein